MSIKCPHGHDEIYYVQRQIEYWEVESFHDGTPDLAYLDDAHFDSNFIPHFRCEECDKKYSVKEIAECNKEG